MWQTGERHQWMLSLFLGGVGLYASRVALPICSVSIAKEMGWDRRDMGLIMGVFFWGYAMTQFLAGHLSDRLGGERVIPVSSFLWSLLTLLFAYLPQVSSVPGVAYGLFVCTRFLLGLFQGFYYPSVISLMSRRVHATERNFTHAVLNAGTHVGTLLCGSLGSYLVARSDWRSLFVLIGMTCSIWSLIVYKIAVRQTRIGWSTATAGSVSSDPDEKSRCRSSRLPVISNFRDEINDVKVMDPNHLLTVNQPFSWALFLRQPSFWAMLLANLVHNNCFCIILNWCPTYFHDNFPDARSWVFNMVPWLVMFPSVLLSGVVADRGVVRGVSLTYVRKAINTVVLLGSSVFLLFLTTVQGYYIALVVMSLALACLGFHSSGVLLNPQDIAPNHGGLLYGLMATVGTIPGFLGVYFVGYLLETTRQWSVVFSWTAFVSIVGWIVYTKFGSSEPII